MISPSEITFADGAKLKVSALWFWMRRLRFCLILVSLVLPSACIPSAHTQPFLHLAGLKITIGAAEEQSLVKTLESIARDERLSVGTASFGKTGRQVVNMTLRLNDRTFYHVDNFNNPGEFLLNAYSHEKPDVWRPIWLRIVARLKTTFGSHAVEREFGD